MKDTSTKEPNKYEWELGAPLPECVHMVMPSWGKGREKKKRLGKRNSGEINTGQIIKSLTGTSRSLGFILSSRGRQQSVFSK